MHLVLRLIFLVVDVGINSSLLSSHASVTVAGMQFSNGASIVLFNALMLFIVYVVDFIMVKTQRVRIDYDIGEHFTHR